MKSGNLIKIYSFNPSREKFAEDLTSIDDLRQHIELETA
jgi:hypothetical protein